MRTKRTARRISACAASAGMVVALGSFTTAGAAGSEAAEPNGAGSPPPLPGPSLVVPGPVVPVGPVGPSFGPQVELEKAMALQPGGVQVSDNAVVWGDADVVLVVPDAGATRAPVGLGRNVRRHLLLTESLRSLDLTRAQVSGDPGAAASSDRVGVMATHGCPGGRLVKDYYCFYTDRDFNGRRLQFTGATRASDAADWGFNNQTSSWVSNDVDCTVRAYNAERPAEGAPGIWRQPENAVSTFVGNSNNDKMSYWTCEG